MRLGSTATRHILKRNISIFNLLVIITGIISFLTPSSGSLSISRVLAGAGPTRIELDFDRLPQGQVGIVRVTGSNIAAVRAVFQERVFLFYAENSEWNGLIAADMALDAGIYPLQVWVEYSDDEPEIFDQTVEVENGAFGRSDVTVSASLVPLLDPDIEQSEMDKLANIVERTTPERYWTDSGFALPVDQELSGWFGTWRLYNGTYWGRHTGVDTRVGVGTPLAAIANGRVVLAGSMTIRGNYVLIDHGWGVFSGYAHLDQMLVIPGQWVRKGEIIGMSSGLNGRSNGAHLHWEMSVNGVWIDPESFLALDLGQPVDD